MKKIAWITDSSCGLSREFIEKHNIYVIPLHVILNGVSYEEDVDLTSEEFYEKLKTYGEGAMTSQPAFGKFIELYEHLKETYECAIAIHASNALTGTYESSLNAARQINFSVEVIDSKMGAYALGKMIQDGIELEKQGKSYTEIVQALRSYPERAEMYLLPKSLGQLKRSGRVSTTQAVFASLLNINVILAFKNGKVLLQEKVRTKRRAKHRLFEIIDRAVRDYQVKELCVMHAGVLDVAQTWKRELEQIHEQLKVKIEMLVPVAGVHTGFGTMAVSWIR